MDIFFVISGFLTTAILFRQLESGDFSFSIFYLRRIRRLAPALFVVLILVVLVGWLALFPVDLIDLSNQILASQFFVSNIFFWRSINYFGLQAENVYLLHTWSLSVEEQFYLVFPLLLFLVHRYFRAWIWPVLALGCLVSFSLNIYLVGSKPEATFYLLPSRAWELLAGSLTYWAVSRRNEDWLPGGLLGVIGLGLIVSGVITHTEGTPFPGWFALLPVLGAVCILLGGSRSPTVVSNFLSSTPLVYIGKISYVLYLVHWPVHVFSKQILASQYTTPIRCGMLLASFLIAMAVFHLVEDPIRRGRFSLFKNGIGLARGYLAGVIFTVGAVISVHLMQGFPGRFPPEAMRIGDFVKDGSLAPDCEFDGSPISENQHFCRIGVKNVEPNWLVYGDSHAAVSFDAFDQWLVSQGRAGLFKFKSGCLPILGIHRIKDKGLCIKLNAEIVEFLEGANSIDNVLLVSSWHQPLDRGAVSSDGFSILSRDDSIKLFDSKFAETVQYIHNRDKKLFIWEPLPGARSNVPLEMARSQISGIEANLEFTLEEYSNEFEFFFSSLNKQKNFIEHSFSPSAMLCQTGRCKVSINGSPLYRDNAHVTASSASVWLGMLQTQFDR